MAALGEGLYARLIGDATVAGLVGLRVYPAPVPQEAALPCLAYVQISRNEPYHHRGASGLVTVRMQVTAHGATHPETRAVADAVRVALAGRWHGWGPVAVSSCRLVNELDRWVDSLERPVIVQDFMITFREVG